MFQGHPSWRSILGFYIKGLLAVLVIAFLVALTLREVPLRTGQTTPVEPQL